MTRNLECSALFFKAFTVGVSLFLSTSLASTQVLSLETWAPTTGDSFVVDTSNNVGYLRHSNGSYFSFPVVTGQRRIVHYIGKTYDATTPVRNWIVHTLENKSDHITFGQTGRFFRLTDNDDGESTSYGIHGHAYADSMLSKNDRYRSMGCIIVNERILDIIEKTFEANGNSLQVQTTNGTPQGVESPVQ